MRTLSELIKNGVGEDLKEKNIAKKGGLDKKEGNLSDVGLIPVTGFGGK